MVLSGDSIRARGIVKPFEERTKLNGLTYGVSHAGYGVRCGQTHFIQPGGFVLASTLEAFDMPLDVLGVVHDKSTWARLGLAVRNTVLEPGWGGFLTLELTNHSDKEIVVDRGAPIAQILFHLVDNPVRGCTGKHPHQGSGQQPAFLEE
jgi:dCTP deaminase